MQFLFYLNPKVQVSSHLLWLYSPVCVGPGRKPRRPVFSERGSYCINRKMQVFLTFFRQFFKATVFSKLLQTDPYGRISIMQFFNYVMRKVWLHQTRIGLSLYDVAGQGYLKESVSSIGPVRSGSKLFDTHKVFLKNFLKKLILKKNQQTTKLQNYPACKELK